MGIDKSGFMDGITDVLQQEVSNLDANDVLIYEATPSNLTSPPGGEIFGPPHFDRALFDGSRVFIPQSNPRRMRQVTS